MEGEVFIFWGTQVNKEQAVQVIHDLSRKQFLLVGEDDPAKRRKLVESILEEEIEILKDLLSVE